MLIGKSKKLFESLKLNSTLPDIQVYIKEVLKLRGFSNQTVKDKLLLLAEEVGEPYDAHHIIENKYGGDNVWWNITPAKFPDEHQAGIHAAGGPARSLFK